MSSIIIDNANQDDIPALAALLAELFSIEKDFKPDANQQIAGLQLIMNNPEQAVIKVARNHQGTAVGMVSAQLVISTAQGAASAWIEDMVISEHHRAAGLGKTLLKAALEWAKKKAPRAPSYW